MKQKIILTLLVILILVQVNPINSQEIQTTFIFDVSESGFVGILQLIRVQGGDLEKVSLYLPFEIKRDTLSVYPIEYEFDLEIKSLGGGTLIVLNLSNLESEEIEVRLEYYTNELTSKEGETWILRIPPLDGDLKIIMPENSEISYILTEAQFPGISQQEERIVLYWEEVSSDVSIYYKLSFKEHEGLNWSFYLVILLSLTTLALLFKFKLKRKKRLNEAILSVLDDRERRVCEFLYLNGRSRHAKISRGTRIPKTTLSKVLLRLEERGIILRERDGKLTFCELKKEALR
ncbi:MAG: helix-turn-helix transcriptional regulator [Candidatus Methanofastidiosia archaeon]